MKRLSDEEKVRLKAKVQQERVKRIHCIVHGGGQKKPIRFLKIIPIVIIGTAIAILLLTLMWLITLVWLATHSIDLIRFYPLIAFYTVPTAIMIAGAISGFYFRKNPRFLKIILTIMGADGIAFLSLLGGYTLILGISLAGHSPIMSYIAIMAVPIIIITMGIISGSRLTRTFDRTWKKNVYTVLLIISLFFTYVLFFSGFCLLAFALTGN